MSVIQSLTYQWVESPNDLKDALAKGLIPLYRTCFSNPPYNEFYTDDDVCTVFNNYSKNQSSILIAYDPQEKVVGFSVKKPLQQLPVGMQALNKDASYCYGADLGVDPVLRRQKISTELEDRQRVRMKQNYNIEITRTSASSYDRIANNLKQGKRRLPYTETVAMQRLDGTTGYDDRIYFELDLQREKQTPDLFVSPVTIARVESSDIAFVMDQDAYNKKVTLAPFIKDNYPGLTQIVFVKDAPEADDFNAFASTKSTVIFNGRMPLNNPSDTSSIKVLTL